MPQQQKVDQDLLEKVRRIRQGLPPTSTPAPTESYDPLAEEAQRMTGRQTGEPYDPLTELDPRLLQTGGGDVRQPQQNRVFQGVLDEWWNIAKAQPHFIGSILKVARGVDPQYAPEALQTLKELLVEPAMETGRQAKEAWKEGETAKAITKGALAGVPLIGPGVADIYDEMKSEDPEVRKHGYGRMIGLLSTFGLGELGRFGAKKGLEGLKGVGERAKAEVEPGPIPGAHKFQVEGPPGPGTAFEATALGGPFGVGLQKQAAEARQVPVHQYAMEQLGAIEPTPKGPPTSDVLQAEAAARLERVKTEREAPIAEIEARQQALKEAQQVAKEWTEQQRQLKARELEAKQIQRFGEPEGAGPKAAEAIDLLTTDRYQRAKQQEAIRRQEAELEGLEYIPEEIKRPLGEKTPKEKISADWQLFENLKSRQEMPEPSITPVVETVRRIFDPSVERALVDTLPAPTIRLLNNILEKGKASERFTGEMRLGDLMQSEAYRRLPPERQMEILAEAQLATEAPATTLSFDAIQKARSSILDTLRDKRMKEKLKPQEIRVLEQIAGSMKTVLTDAVRNTGNPRLMRAWSKANKGTREYYRTYDVSMPKAIKRYIESGTKRGLPPENIIDSFFNKKRTVQNARDMVRALSPEMTQQALADLKAGIMERAWERSKTPENLLAELTHRDFKNKYEAIFGKEGYSKLVDELQTEVGTRVTMRERAKAEIGELEAARQALEEPKAAIQKAPEPTGLEYEKKIAQRGVSDQIRNIFSTKETEYAAQAANVAKRKGRLSSLHRESIEHILDMSMQKEGQKFAEGWQKGWFEGPKFKDTWKAQRPKLEAMGVPEKVLKGWDAFAQEVGEYKTIPPTKVGTIVDLHIIIGGLQTVVPGILIGAFTGGGPGAAAGAMGGVAAWVIGKRGLAKIGLMPQGPKAFRRMLQLDRIDPKAADFIRDFQRLATAAGVTMTPVSKKQMDELLKAP